MKLQTRLRADIHVADAPNHRLYLMLLERIRKGGEVRPAASGNADPNRPFAGAHHLDDKLSNDGALADTEEP